MKKFHLLINLNKGKMFISEEDSSDLKRIYYSKGYAMESFYNMKDALKRKEKLSYYIH